MSTKLPMNQVLCRNSPCKNTKCGFKHELTSNLEGNIGTSDAAKKLPMNQVLCRNNPCKNTKCGFKHEVTNNIENNIGTSDAQNLEPVTIAAKKLLMNQVLCRNNPCKNTKCGFKHLIDTETITTTITDNVLPSKCMLDKASLTIETCVNKTKAPMNQVACRNNPCLNKKCGFKHPTTISSCEA